VKELGRISVELIPRSEDGLREDLQIVKKNAPGVELINIPDLLRIDMRS
jgi:methylenetetrahydrofolate reductase (NADPH)